MEQRYDVAIIGTGPAGLSAAITLKARNKNIIIFGSSCSSEKVEKAHTIGNYLGIPDVKGKDLAEKFIEHTKSMGIAISEERITAVYAMGEYFSLQSGNNIFYEATSIILATGVDFGKPYSGEDEFRGSGVSYCATCDAPLYRDKDVAIISFSKKEEAEADYMSEIAKKVYYIPMYKDEINVSEKVCIIEDLPVAIEGNMKAEKLKLKEQVLNVDGIFILRESVSPSKLVYGLKSEDNHIAVNRKMETNLKGCFACGDVTGPPYQYIKAAGEGNVAALSAVGYIDEIKRTQKKEKM